MSDVDGASGSGQAAAAIYRPGTGRPGLEAGRGMPLPWNGTKLLEI